MSSIVPNGTPATRAELHALEKLFDAKLEPVRDDLGEIKEALRAMAMEAWLGPRGREMITGAGLLASAVAVAIAVLR